MVKATSWTVLFLSLYASVYAAPFGAVAAERLCGGTL